MSTGIREHINDTKACVGAVTGKRFCQRVAGGMAQCTASGQQADAISLYDGADTKEIAFGIGGFYPVTSGAALTDGQPVMSDAAGKAIPWASASGRARAGYADHAVSGADQTVIIFHRPDAILVP